MLAGGIEKLHENARAKKYPDKDDAAQTVCQTNPTDHKFAKLKRERIEQPR